MSKTVYSSDTNKGGDQMRYFAVEERKPSSTEWTRVTEWLRNRADAERAMSRMDLIANMGSDGLPTGYRIVMGLTGSLWIS